MAPKQITVWSLNWPEILIYNGFHWNIDHYNLHIFPPNEIYCKTLDGAVGYIYLTTKLSSDII